MEEKNGRSGAARSASAAMQHFLVVDAGELTAKIGSLNGELTDRVKVVAAAFQENVSAAATTVGIPVTLAWAASMRSHMQRIHAAERIRSLILTAEAKEDAAALDVRRAAWANGSASQRFNEFRTSADGQSHLADDACDFLVETLKFGNLGAAASELLRQGVVLAWSSLEILSRDLFETIVNADPGRALLVLEEPAAKQRLQSKLTLQELAEVGFDLSSSLGSYLSSRQDFSDIRTIKAVLSPALESDARVAAALDDRELWLLCQCRHLIVHRRGVVDARYNEATGEARIVGERLMVAPKALESQLAKVVDAGHALLQAAASQGI